MLSATTDRQALGQWFTPPAVADLVLALAADGRRDVDVLDPTCGEGVFLDRAVRAGYGRVRGLELDPELAAATARRHEDVTQGSLFDLDPDLSQAGLVVGNPPYVRQDRVDDATRSKALSCLGTDWGDVAGLAALGRRSDLAALCIARMVRLVKPGGRVGLVISSALFDASSARALWLGLQQVAAVVAIVESPEERWFADAAVNAAIVILERGAKAHPFPVARLRVPIAEAPARISRLADLASMSEIRSAHPEHPESWASLLRADDAWFALQSECTSSLVPLAEIATVRRGVTAGANKVFYLPRGRAQELGLEPASVVPLVRSPRESGAASIDIDPATTSHVAVALPPVADAERRFPAAWRYLMAHAGIAERPTLRARDPWWALPVTRAQLFLAKAYGARFVQRFSASPLACDQRLYAVTPNRGVDVEVLAGILNSSYTSLALESLGRASLGQGALEWTVAQAMRLPIADPRAADAEAAGAVRSAFRAISSRAIGDVEDEAGRDDRLALDRAVARILGPKVALQPGEAQQALIASVRRRHRKASSLKKA